MKHSLYLKFILGYLLFGLLGFTAIASCSYQMMYDNFLKSKTEAMY